MPRKPKQSAPETTPPPAPSSNGTETVAGYFRRVFEEDPRLLHERSNDPLYARWLADHPGHTEVPDNVKANLQNLKSVLRKQKGKRKPRKEQTAETPPAPPAKPRPSSRSLEQLEGMIDECLFAARGLKAEGLETAIGLLRAARNAVIRQAGAEG